MARPRQFEAYFLMEGAGPRGESDDREPISPELAMIDPELARRRALMPAVWKTVQVAQAAALEAPDVDVDVDVDAAGAACRRTRWWLLPAAAAVVGGGLLVLLSVGLFSSDSRVAAVPTAPAKPPVGHASAKRVSSRPPVRPPATARPDVAERRVAQPAAAAPPATAKAAAPAPTAASRRPAKPHVQPQPQPRAAKRRVARRAAVAPPATAKAAAPAARTATSRAPAKPHVQPQRRAAKPRVVRPAVVAPPATAKKAAPAEPSQAPRSPVKPRKSELVAAGAAAAPRVAPFTSGPRTFVWTSVPGATEYHVAFFKGGRAILVRRTRSARLTVPGSWRYAGKVETLSPGRYRWYVWFARGRQSTGTVVNSTIVIGR
jgi:hypothetical protein